MLKKKKPTRPEVLKWPRRGYTQIPTDKYTHRILQDMFRQRSRDELYPVSLHLSDHLVPGVSRTNIGRQSFHPPTLMIPIIITKIWTYSVFIVCTIRQEDLQSRRVSRDYWGFNVFILRLVCVVNWYSLLHWTVGTRTH